MVCMFPYWTEAFLIGQCCFCGWSSFRKDYLCLENPFYWSGALTDVCCMLVLQHFHCVYHPQFSGLVAYTKGTIKNQLAKFIETLQIPRPKTLPLLLLNLSSTPFGTHRLSPFEIVTGCPIHLTPASLDSQLVKEIYFNIVKALLLLLKMIMFW